MSGPDGRDDPPAGDRELDPERSDKAGPKRDDPPQTRPDGDDPITPEDGYLRWFLSSENDMVVLTRDVITSVAVVALIGFVLFGISGIWPPLVAVESGSMEPNMHRGDLIFLVDTDRFVGDDPVEDTGIVPLEQGEANGHETFGNPGDVIVFQRAEADAGTPIIHRAHFWVEEGENWIETQADEDIAGETTCAEVQTCPANHDGFVTKGDNNQGYDQLQGELEADVIRPEWVSGKAQYRIPWLGHVRLFFDSLFTGMAVPGTTAQIVSLVGGFGLAGALTANRHRSI